MLTALVLAVPGVAAEDDAVDCMTRVLVGGTKDGDPLPWTPLEAPGDQGSVSEEIAFFVLNAPDNTGNLVPYASGHVGHLTDQSDSGYTARLIDCVPA